MGCVPSYLGMKMTPSLVRVLDDSGLYYTTLSVDENCFGFPLYLMGSDKFESHAENLMEQVKSKGARELVTPCAGCFKTFKKIYLEIGDLGVEVYHSVHYLAKLIDAKKIKFEEALDKKVIYHDPCGLGRAFKILKNQEIS
ncbi:MAG: (Fe-S)-binding protein [Desulfatiglandales bacterium]|jgi:glycolate oxidase|nr:(Fe-S)-binding protein [Desulfatiglandales bacterium]